MAISTPTTAGQILTSAYVNNNINSGMVYVAATTFTASSSVTVDNCFSSLYDNYKVTIQWLQNTTGGGAQFKFKDAGGVVSTASYGSRAGGNFRSGATNNFAAYSNVDSVTSTAGIFIGSAGAATRGYAVFEILSPNLAQQTNLMGQYMGTSDGTNNFLNLQIGGWQDSSTQMVGLNIAPAAGTMTGVITVFGYRKA
jgi:hypothetical protein